jgi:hypothetical protein
MKVEVISGAKRGQLAIYGKNKNIGDLCKKESKDLCNRP